MFNDQNRLNVNGSKRKEIFFLLVCLLIGFGLRFYAFDRKSLWLDEIYTFNDSRYGLQDQLRFYKENPTYLHPPLFFVVSHLFYPFSKPERDLRIVPMVFGILSILIIYLLSRLFAPKIAFPCTLSLSLMVYHIYLSQEARWYTLLMFLGSTGLFFLMKHLLTAKKWYLLPAAFFFAMLLYTSYSSIPFITFSQILWFYRLNEENRQPSLRSFFIFNGLLLLFCCPWILFIASNYRNQLTMISLNQQDTVSFFRIVGGVVQDWVPHLPLTIISATLLILFPVFSKARKNALLLLAIFILPIGGVYVYWKLSNVTHFITSRYFINFLPLFLITLYMSIIAFEDKFEKFGRFLRFRYLFVILFVASNLIILPLYYRSEKQDFRGLVTYLKGQLREGDHIIVGSEFYITGMLHYFGVYPVGRFYLLPTRLVQKDEIEYKVFLTIENRRFAISYSKDYWVQYFRKANRLWIVVDQKTAKELKKLPAMVPKGYFDGSFVNFDRFPTDASLYLFLWNPQSSESDRIDMMIE